MAKEIAIGKRAKISQAQQYMLLAVLGAAIFLGAAISLVSHFSQQISFNSKVIAATEESIANYSKIIKETGVCKAPSGGGTIYSDSDLDNCKPEEIETKEIPDTLRANILDDLAANPALNSVPKEDSIGCKDPTSQKVYTYKDLKKIKEEARGAAELQAASDLIKRCSALRVIPDALPSFKNEEALLASLNKLFLAADWEPEAITPGDSADPPEFGHNLNAISVNFLVDADSGTAMKVLDNIERSIREFNITHMVINWAGSDGLSLQTQATAYSMDESSIIESKKTITPGGK